MKQYKYLPKWLAVVLLFPLFYLILALLLAVLQWTAMIQTDGFTLTSLGMLAAYVLIGCGIFRGIKFLSRYIKNYKKVKKIKNY